MQIDRSLTGIRHPESSLELERERLKELLNQAPVDSSPWSPRRFRTLWSAPDRDAVAVLAWVQCCHVADSRNLEVASRYMEALLANGFPRLTVHVAESSVRNSGRVPMSLITFAVKALMTLGDSDAVWRLLAKVKKPTPPAIAKLIEEVVRQTKESNILSFSAS